jgi:hypothetical protein
MWMCPWPLSPLRLSLAEGLLDKWKTLSRTRQDGLTAHAQSKYGWCCGSSASTEGLIFMFHPSAYHRAKVHTVHVHAYVSSRPCERLRSTAASCSYHYCIPVPSSKRITPVADAFRRGALSELMDGAGGSSSSTEDPDLMVPGVVIGTSSVLHVLWLRARDYGSSINRGVQPHRCHDPGYCRLAKVERGVGARAILSLWRRQGLYTCSAGRLLGSVSKPCCPELLGN